jgi:hypothetical protein
MQPLGDANLGSGHPGVGVTLNGRGLPGSLAERISQAVAEAAAAGLSRRDVVAKFADQPKTVVYREIAKAIAAMGATLAPTKLPRRSRGMTEDEQAAELGAMMPSIDEIERLAAGDVMPTVDPASTAVDKVRPGSGRDLLVKANGAVTVDIGAGMVKALEKAEALMNLAEDENGTGIRNARLMVVAVDLFGRTAERKARIDADLSDASRQDAFLRQVGEAIMAEPPEVRKRILARLRTINPSWGV